MIDKGVKIGDLLVQEGLIDAMQLRAALGHQKRWGGKIGKVVVDLGFITEDAMLRFLSVHFKLKAVNLLRSRITAQTFETVPESVAKKYQVVPVVVREVAGKKTIVLAMNDPTDLRAIDEITFLTGAKIEPVLATDSAIAKVLSRYGDFTPEATEYHFQEQASPAQLRQARQATAKPTAPPPVRPAPTQPAPRPSPPPPPRPTPPEPPPAREDDFGAPSNDELELIKGEVTMLRATKPGGKKSAAPPQRPTMRPSPSDVSPILGRSEPTKPRTPTSPAPVRPAPPPAEPKTTDPGAFQPPPAPLAPPAARVEPPPLDEAPVLPDLAPLPEVAPLPDSLAESNVLLQAHETKGPPSLDVPPPAVDFLDDVAQASELPRAQDNGMEIPEAGDEIQLADAYEFIPNAPAKGPVPEADPITPTEPAGPPPFDADSISAVISENDLGAAPPVPPEIEWGHPGDDFFSMPVPGGITDKPEAMPDLPTLSPTGTSSSPLDEEWPPAPVMPPPDLVEVSPVAIKPTTDPAENFPTISPDFLEPLTGEPSPPATTPEASAPVFEPPSPASPPLAVGDDPWSGPSPTAVQETAALPSAPEVWEGLDETTAAPGSALPPDEPTNLWGDFPPPTSELSPPAAPAPLSVPTPPDFPQTDNIWDKEAPAPGAPPATDDLWSGDAPADDLWAAEPNQPAPSQAKTTELPDLEWVHDSPSASPPPKPDWNRPGTPDEIPRPPAPNPWNEIGPAPPARPTPGPFIKSAPPDLAPPEWEHLEPPAPPDANEILPWEEPGSVTPAPPSPLPVDGLMVEEIGNLKAEPKLPPPPRFSAPLPFEAPPPEVESDLPVIEAMPLRDAMAESKPGFDIISEPVVGESDPLAPIDSDELVTEVPTFEQTVLKMKPVTVEDEKPPFRELPETVLLPPSPTLPLPPPAPAPAPPESEALPRVQSRPPAPAAEPAPVPGTDGLGEMRAVVAAPDESPELEATRAELEKLEDLGDGFLDTREVRDKLLRISELEREVKAKEFQFDDLLSLMMKKELGEITQELFMKELAVLKKKMDESRRKHDG